MTMRKKFCKRQLQTASTVVIVSGFILVAMWAAYFTHPSIFKNVKVDLIPAKIAGLSYIFGNSSGIATTPTVRIASYGTVEEVELKTDLNEHEVVSTGFNGNETAAIVKAILGSENNTTGTIDTVFEKVDSNKVTDIATTTRRSNDIKVSGATSETIDAIGNIPLSDIQVHTTVVKDADSKDDIDIQKTTSSQVAKTTPGYTNKLDVKDNNANETTTYTNDEDQASQINTTNAQFSTDNSIIEETGTPTNNASDVATTKTLEETTLSTNGFANATESSTHGDGATVDTDEITDSSVKLNIEKVGGISTPKYMTKRMNNWDESKDSPYINLYLRINERVINHTILLWNAPDWIKLASVELDMGDCSYRSCKLTIDHQQIGISSAVVFHHFDEDYNAIQKDRKTGQVWILHSLRPLDTEPLPDSLDGAFNWTWTYRTSADIFHSYGALFSRTEIPGKSYGDIFRRKTVSAMLFARTCSVPGWIKDTIYELSKHFTVNAYTPCDELTPQDIDKLVNDKYTFYLGFEDILCEDYITEQFFHFFGLDVVVVVMGLGQYNLLPRDSFVRAGDFLTVGKLAEYLADLGSNEDMYTGYLKNKDRFEIKEKDYIYRNSLCHICERLNNLDQYQQVHTEQDVKDSLGHC